MSDFAVPRRELAAAKQLDHQAMLLRTGGEKSRMVAETLRQIADMIDTRG